MYRTLDVGLSQVNKELLTMAGYVEQAIESATQAARLRSFAKIQDVYAIEQKVNRAHIEVDDACVKLLALQQPMAADLRFLIAIIKINNELERMVDLAVNIANNTEHYLKVQGELDLTAINEMADEVRIMVREVLNAFVRMDEPLAREVLRRDDLVDQYKRDIFDAMVARMKADPESVSQGVNIILMAKNLERVGDHATNIAEDVIYMASGQDVRHTVRGHSPRDESGGK